MVNHLISFFITINGTFVPYVEAQDSIDSLFINRRLCIMKSSLTNVVSYLIFLYIDFINLLQMLK
jgi:hypothetical protein